MPPIIKKVSLTRSLDRRRPEPIITNKDACSAIDNKSTLKSRVSNVPAAINFDISDTERLLANEEDDVSLTVANPSTPVIKVYRRRYWILFIYCLFTWFCVVQWNCWGPISASMITAFPDWDSTTIAMMENWVSLFYVISVGPIVMLVSRYGLRKGIIASSFLLAAGLSLRCITDQSPLFTIMCHLSAVFLGISITLALAAPTMLAAEWFSFSERTTATALIMATSQLGAVGSYLEPLLVSEPGPNVPVSIIKSDVMMLMYICACVGTAIFICFLLYFPSKPPLPPSLSSEERLDFCQGLCTIFRNRSLLALMLIYGIACGPSLAWLGMLNFSLQEIGFHQNESMIVGLVSVSACFIVTLLTGYLTDHLFGHLKETVIVLLLAASCSYYWFLLISDRVIPLVKWQVYVSVSSALAFNYAALPLFYELASEMAYPASEVVVGGIVTTSDSIFSTIFLFLYFIKGIGFWWVTYTLVGSNALVVIPLLMIKVSYARSNIDKEGEAESLPSTSIDSSTERVQVSFK